MCNGLSTRGDLVAVFKPFDTAQASHSRLVVPITLAPAPHTTPFVQSANAASHERTSTAHGTPVRLVAETSTPANQCHPSGLRAGPLRPKIVPRHDNHGAAIDPDAAVRGALPAASLAHGSSALPGGQESICGTPGDRVPDATRVIRCEGENVIVVCEAGAATQVADPAVMLADVESPIAGRGSSETHSVAFVHPFRIDEEASVHDSWICRVGDFAAWVLLVGVPLSERGQYCSYVLLQKLVLWAQPEVLEARLHVSVVH